MFGSLLLERQRSIKHHLGRKSELIGRKEGKTEKESSKEEIRNRKREE
jgi:hypothetical protein